MKPVDYGWNDLILLDWTKIYSVGEKDGDKITTEILNKMVENYYTYKEGMLPIIWDKHKHIDKNGVENQRLNLGYISDLKVSDDGEFLLAQFRLKGWALDAVMSGEYIHKSVEYFEKFKTDGKTIDYLLIGIAIGVDIPADIRLGTVIPENQMNLYPEKFDFSNDWESVRIFEYQDNDKLVIKSEKKTEIKSEKKIDKINKEEKEKMPNENVKEKETLLSDFEKEKDLLVKEFQAKEEQNNVKIKELENIIDIQKKELIIFKEKELDDKVNILIEKGTISVEQKDIVKKLFARESSLNEKDLSEASVFNLLNSIEPVKSIEGKAKEHPGFEFEKPPENDFSKMEEDAVLEIKMKEFEDAGDSSELAYNKAKSFIKDLRSKNPENLENEEE